MTEERKRKPATVTLTLRNRKATGNVMPISTTRLQAVVRVGKDALWNFFEPLQNGTGEVHDRVWLEQIVNSTPQGGLPLTKMVPWFKLAERVAETGDDNEVAFDLHKKEVDLIWDRVTGKSFSLDTANAAFWGFLQDFMAATGKELPDDD